YCTLDALRMIYPSVKFFAILALMPTDRILYINSIDGISRIPPVILDLMERAIKTGPPRNKSYHVLLQATTSDLHRSICKPRKQHGLF
ncbi:hypothetical protein ACJX0J_008776, partial [Zea mays]